MLKNLTPHKITIFLADDVRREIPPSGEVARVETTIVPTGTVDGIPLLRTEFGQVIDLPDPQTIPCRFCGGKHGIDCTGCSGTGLENVLFLVSRVVLEAVKDTRNDVFAPGELVRDEEGRPIGCKGLSR